MESREQGPARRSAVDASVVVIEFDPFLRQLVDMGSSDELLTIASKHSRTEIIRENQYDIGARLAFLRFSCAKSTHTPHQSQGENQSPMYGNYSIHHLELEILFH